MISFQLARRDFAFYDASAHDWSVNPGKFDILVGASSHDLPLKQTMEVEATQPAYPSLTRHSLLKEFANHPKGKAFHRQLVEAFGLGNPYEQSEELSTLAPDEAATKRKADMAVTAFLDDMPVYKVCRFSENRFTEEMLEDILKQVR